MDMKLYAILKAQLGQGSGSGGNGIGIIIDPTLTETGQAADAQVVGDRIADLTTQIEKLAAISGSGTVAVIAINDEIVEAEDGVINIPIGSGNALGVVKSTDEENGIAIREDGTMYLNSISMDKVVQGESADGTETTVIFSGGGAS